MLKKIAKLLGFGKKLDPEKHIVGFDYSKDGGCSVLCEHDKETGVTNVLEVIHHDKNTLYSNELTSSFIVSQNELKQNKKIRQRISKTKKMRKWKKYVNQLDAIYVTEKWKPHIGEVVDFYGIECEVYDYDNKPDHYFLKEGNGVISAYVREFTPTVGGDLY